MEQTTPFAINVLHVWSRGRKNEQQNNAPNLKKQTNNAAARYQGQVRKTEFSKGAGLLISTRQTDEMPTPPPPPPSKRKEKLR